MFRKLVSFGFASMAFAVAGFTGPGGLVSPFANIPQAAAINILCPGGTEPTCSPIYDANGNTVGYTCICG
jgi:hypothetical protein